MEEVKQEKRTKQPFNMGIKALKKQLEAGGMPKSTINKTVAIYKKKVYDRVAEVKAKMEKEFEGEVINASNK